MLVPPAPVCFAIIVFEVGKIVIPAVILFCPHSICSILVIIPLMIVILSPMVVGSLVIFGAQRCGSQEHRSEKGCP